MKRVLFFLLFLIIGFGITTFIMYSQQQQVKKQVEQQAKKTGFSLERAPSDSLRGTIASLSGSVQWQSRVATQPAELKTPRTIQQGEELWTGKDGSISVQLSNGHSITLFPNSHVNFIQTLPSSIVLKQDAGSITYQANGKSSLSVTSLNLLTTMTDGKMTIMVNKTQDGVSTTVLQGKATEAYNDANNTTSVSDVLAGQTFGFDDTVPQGAIQ